MAAGDRRRQASALRGFRAAVAALGLLSVAGLTASWWAPYPPNEQLDPYVGRLRAPGTTLHAVLLDDGRSYLAERVERVGDRLRIERRDRVEEIDIAEVANLTDDGEGVRDRRRFLLGSDRLGRDVLSRLALGGRVSLLVGLLSMALSMTVGVLVGAIAALGPRVVDALLMRTVDGLLAFPWFFLLLALAALVPTSLTMLVLILGGSGWMTISRLARAEIAGIADRDFVHAARGLGSSEPRIFLRHVLPNVLTPLTVAATFRIGSLILAEAALSYLGLGVPPPHPSWGNMIADGRSVLTEGWWGSLFPALCLILTVALLTLVADGLRDALDPRRST